MSFDHPFWVVDGRLRTRGSNLLGSARGQRTSASVHPGMPRARRLNYVPAIFGGEIIGL
jgi:hypothetical protein